MQTPSKHWFQQQSLSPVLTPLDVELFMRKLGGLVREEETGKQGGTKTLAIYWPDGSPASNFLLTNPQYLLERIAAIFSLVKIRVSYPRGLYKLPIYTVNINQQRTSGPNLSRVLWLTAIKAKAKVEAEA